MTIGKRVYWVIALVAVMALAGAAVTLTARLTSAEPTPTAVQPCDQEDEADDAIESAAEEADDDAIEEECGDQNEAEGPNGGTDRVVPCSDPTGADNDVAEAQSGPDADNIEEQCGDQNEADDANEVEDGDPQAPSGTLDDGKELLAQAGITVEQAVAAAQGAASGPVGEVDLEHWQGKLVFNVDIGDKDVKVDATNGAVLAMDADD